MMRELIDRLEDQTILPREDLTLLIRDCDDECAEYLWERARKVRQKHYQNKVYIRGLIEFTSFCKNNCCYCGLRCGNKNAERYRLSEDEILECCEKGYALGFRTFVLQGGEDSYFTDDRMTGIIRSIKSRFPDCALTLSIGERSKASYRAMFEAGADRYLLRHETADDSHYAMLHPPELSPQNRKRCLDDLKSIGYQVGCGFMVGSPFQTPENLADDLLYIHRLQPQMVGIGPFISQHDTPFADKPGGTLRQTLMMLGLVRLVLPGVLLPATTALGTIAPEGREKGILAGANVVMPNLSPEEVRKKYLLYDNKLCTGDEAAESLEKLKKSMEAIGYEIVVDRGDCADFIKNNNSLYLPKGSKHHGL